MFFGSLAFVFEVMIYVGLGLPLVNLLISLIGGAGDSGPDAEVGGDAALDAGADAGFDTAIDAGFDTAIDAGFDTAIDAGFDTALDAGGPDLDVDFDTPDLDLDADLDFDVPDFDPGAAQALTTLEAGAHTPMAPGHAGGHGFALRFNMYCLCLALVVMGAVGIFALETLAGAAQIITLVAGAVMAAGAYALLYRFVIWPLKKNDARALSQNSLRFRHARVTFRIAPDSPGTIQTKDAVGAVISYRAEIDRDLCTLDRIEEGTEVIITDLDKAQHLCYVAPAQRKILDTHNRDHSNQ